MVLSKPKLILFAGCESNYALLVQSKSVFIGKLFPTTYCMLQEHLLLSQDVSLNSTVALSKYVINTTDP